MDNPNLKLISKYFIPKRVLDIGANRGQFHNDCKYFYPDCFIYSIEATRECEPDLAKQNPNYYIGFLGDEKKLIKFYKNKTDLTSTGNSKYRELTNYYRDDNIIITEEPVILLDELFQEKFKPDEYFDLIKLDTQGSELDIMKGGKLTCNKSKGILIELSIKRYNENSPLMGEVNDYIQNMGFVPVEELLVTRHPFTGEISQCDVLYIKI